MTPIEKYRSEKDKIDILSKLGWSDMQYHIAYDDSLMS